MVSRGAQKGYLGVPWLEQQKLRPTAGWTVTHLVGQVVSWEVRLWIRCCSSGLGRGWKERGVGRKPRRLVAAVCPGSE